MRTATQAVLFATRRGPSPSCIDLIRGIDKGSSMNDDTQSPEAPATKLPGSARKRWLLLVAGSFALIAVAYGVYWTLALRYVQSTDDAYVSGNVVQITPQISGTVIAIGADDTQFVKAGQTLVQLDQADAKIALDQADAQLAKSVREVRNLFATTAQLQATVSMRQSDLVKANDDLARRDRFFFKQKTAYEIHS